LRGTIQVANPNNRLWVVIGLSCFIGLISMPYIYEKTRPEVAEVQKKLRIKGFNPGSVDGVFGSLTEEAVKHFQQANNLTPTGIVDRETYSSLLSNTEPE
jgi:murein L,D-transpeptidase YcbB/YkuD